MTSDSSLTSGTETTAPDTGLEWRSLRWLVRVIVYFVCASLVLFVVVMKPPGIDGDPRSSVPAMIEGTAHRPFVYRRLLPEAARLLAAQMPARLKQLVTVALSEPKRQVILDYLRWDSGHLLWYGSILLLSLACYIGFALVLRRLLRRLYDPPGSVVEFAPAIALVLLPILFRNNPRIYDAGTLLTFTLGFLCLVERRNVLFYPALALASFNKETAVLLIPLFAMRYWDRMKRPALAAHLIAQLILWTGITAAIRIAYRSNPGGAVEFHLMDHNAVLFRQPFYLAYLIIQLAVAALLLRRTLPQAPSFLRRSFFLVFATLFTATLFLGLIDETRDYLEVWPLFCLVVMPGVARQLDRGGRRHEISPVPVP